jgi:phage baseplate assembly protein W
MEYLSLPLVLREGYLGRASLRESLANSIGLILSTRIGSLRFDPDYGCGIWDREYADLLTANKADLRASLRNALDKYEKRIYDMSVSFTVVGGTARHPLGLAVKVTGNYREDAEEKKFEGTFVIG